jgi:hypothetical protein
LIFLGRIGGKNDATSISFGSLDPRKTLWLLCYGLSQIVRLF